MAQRFYNRIFDRTQTQGSGPYYLDNLQAAGFRPVAAAVPTGQNVILIIAHQENSQWEFSEWAFDIGTYALNRVQVFESSAGVGIALNFSPGPKDVFSDIPAQLIESIMGPLPLSGLDQSGATVGQVPTWNGSAWIPATPTGGGGGGGDPGIYVEETPSGSVNGSNAIFTLANPPAQADSLQVFVNGLKQRRGSSASYTLTGSTITFNAGSIPQSGDHVGANYLRSS